MDEKPAPLLTDRAVIVTGAGQGLGRAYAEHAGAEGAAVLVNDIDASAADEVCRAIIHGGGVAHASGHDIADWDAAAELVAICSREFGSVDGLVNNAGVISVAAPGEDTEATITNMVRVNLAGAAFVGTHAIRVMRAAGRGSIVNATSSAQMGLSRLGVYGATKGALASLTYSWAIDLAPAGIRVNAYAPVAPTRMTTLAPVSVTDVPPTADNAAVVSYLLSDRSAGISGQVLQRRGTEIVVMAHPDPADAAAESSTWDTAAIISRLDPLLRSSLQPVGDPRYR